MNNNLFLTGNEHIRVCTSIPGCLFSTICLKILEVNFFPRSITVCPQMNVSSKSRKWQISYTCISINTLNTTLPPGMVMSGITTLRPLIQSGGVPAGQIGQPRPAGMLIGQMGLARPPGMIILSSPMSLGTVRPLLQTTGMLAGQMGQVRPLGMMTLRPVVPTGVSVGPIALPSPPGTVMIGINPLLQTTRIVPVQVG
ncbi:uncharacterized protein LOC122509560 [Leptopilina heterotoma]|uniref:uncharacterized protein LOC122509560 n=1 Tax=Leptopilina heterotoma TaxID=63436 RepID=UPI001CA7D4CA|nr:uncharacterized protein LOC122509560 [Leptopilina heterotoma]